MPKTPTSNPGAYCTATTVLSFVAAPLLGDLLVDDGTQATAAMLQDPTTTAGGRLADLVRAACGELEASALRGGRYSADDLAGLVGNAAVFRDKIVAGLAVNAALWRRDATRATPEIVKWAAEQMTALGLGDEIFGLAETAAAGAGMTDVPAPDQQPGPRPNLSAISHRFFGRRAREIPPETRFGASRGTGGA